MFICGDTNSRTSDIPDYVPPHVCEDLPDLIAAQPNILCGSTVDRTMNSYGRKLIGWCKYAGLQICNDRLCASKHTCYEYNGDSVVDYLLTSPNFFWHDQKFPDFWQISILRSRCPFLWIKWIRTITKNLVYKYHREKKRHTRLFINGTLICYRRTVSYT